jgi:cardiolipin synthase (CMP-forming)
MAPEISPGSELPVRSAITGPRPAAAAAAGRRDPNLNLPNVITLARLMSVPVAVWLILGGRYGTAFWVFVVAGASDAVDGYIAKRFDCRTPLGALLDPAADKALLVGVYLSLWLAGQLPGLLVLLVVLRDAAIVLGFVLIHGTAGPKQFDPLYISKLNTLMQIALIGFVLARLGLGIRAESLTWLLIAAAGITTVLSGFSYLAHWARILLRSEPAL